MSDEPVTPPADESRPLKQFAVTIACHDQHGTPTGQEISDVITAHSADMAHGFALAKHGYTLGTPVTVQEQP